MQLPQILKFLAKTIFRYKLIQYILLVELETLAHPFKRPSIFIHTSTHCVVH